MPDEVRYDRQIRLWGDEGQSCIEHANICVLGSSAVACEVMKSLVLAGIKSVHIIDSAIITNPDSGNNFFLEGEVGQPRAKAALKLLMFAVVVGCNLCINLAAQISEYLFEKNIPFVHARAYGLAGYIRISVGEHTIINSHEENLPPDLRLDCPFPSLLDLAKATDLDSMTYETHSHTPYLILFLKTLDIWRKKYGEDNFPDDLVKRKSFEKIFLSLRRPHPENGSILEENFLEGHTAIVRSLRRTMVNLLFRLQQSFLMLSAIKQLPPGTKELLDHPKAHEPDSTRFWLLVAALRRFVISHEVLPLSGSLPDMISDSERYVILATRFLEKAKQDAEEVMDLANAILTERELPVDMIKHRDCEFFCKNASLLRVQHGTSIAQELKSSLEEIFCDIRNADFSPNAVSGVPQVPPAVWYILLRAIDRFYSEKSRYPGTNGVPCTIDAYDLKTRVVGIISDSGITDGSEVVEKIPQSAIDEMCRYGAGEVHVVAALIGGIAAQEVIKLATHQYIPLDNTLIFDGHTQQAHTYRL